MNSERIMGRAFVLGDDVRADEMLADFACMPTDDLSQNEPASAVDAWVDGPADGLAVTRPHASHPPVQYGVLIAGRRFGFGRSGRRTAALLEATGIRAVVAESFAGRGVVDALSSAYIWAFESEYRICDAFETGDQVEVDMWLQGLRFAGSFCILPLRLAAVEVETGWSPTPTPAAGSTAVGV